MKKLIGVISAAFLLMLIITYAAESASVVELRGIWVQDIGGQPLMGLNRPQHTDAVVLSANTAKTYTIPTGARYALFSANADFYVDYSGTAAVPAEDVTDGSAGEMNPVLRSVDGLTSISIVSASSCIVTISVYK